jgi:fructosamine-3-kinase
MDISHIISQSLAVLAGKKIAGNLSLKPFGGGSINLAYKVETGGNNYFLKLNTAKDFPGMFEKEARGLAILAQQNIMSIPAVSGHGIMDEKQWLLLEFIETSLPQPGFWEKFGEQLAHLHQVQAAQFGLDHDNYIGSLLQENRYHDNWADFFLHERLWPQIKLAKHAGLWTSSDDDDFASFSPNIRQIFSPGPPSLLHGDLWSGNFLCDAGNQPVIIDPAVYFGHRSMDLAMSRLFGGFEEDFYKTYYDHFPWVQEEEEVASLYPLLVHLNLFGTSYRSPIRKIIKKFM